MLCHGPSYNTSPQLVLGGSWRRWPLGAAGSAAAGGALRKARGGSAGCVAVERCYALRYQVRDLFRVGL